MTTVGRRLTGIMFSRFDLSFLSYFDPILVHIGRFLSQAPSSRYKTPPNVLQRGLHWLCCRTGNLRSQKKASSSCALTDPTYASYVWLGWSRPSTWSAQYHRCVARCQKFEIWVTQRYSRYRHRKLGFKFSMPRKQAKTLYYTLKLLADVFLYWVALWSTWNAKIGPGLGKPKTARTLLQLIDVETGHNGSTSISNI